MAADLERLAREFGKDERFAAFAAGLKSQAAVARQLGAPETFEPSLPSATPTVWVERDLNITQLVEREHNALKTFFGKEVPVVQPPALLAETLRVAEGEGLSIFQPLYFPAIEFKQNSRFPGWSVKPEEWYWEQIKAGRVDKDAAKLGGYWSLFDESRRPSYDNGKQMFTDDPLEAILVRGRHEGKIEVPDYLREVPKESRFGVSPDEQDKFVFPSIADSLGLLTRVANGQAQVRRPTEMEFNFVGNLRYPHLGQANTWEWMQDRFEDDYRLLGGHSDYGGLAYVSYDWSDYHNDSIAFRPVVAFLPQAA